MTSKAHQPADEEAPVSQIGASLEALASTIAARRGTGSYTDVLLSGPVDAPLKKLMEEAGEVALAAKDASCAVLACEGVDAAEAAVLELQAGSAEGAVALRQSINHLRYEAADVLYHLMVVLERYHVPLDELAAELNSRMTEDERPAGGVALRPEDIERGK